MRHTPVRRISVVMLVLTLVGGCGTLWHKRTEVTFDVGGEAGYGISNSSAGLSIESSALADGASKLLVRKLTKLLAGFQGTPVVRIAGNASDEMFWTATNERMPAGSDGAPYAFRVTPTSLERLNDVVITLGWRVVLGVNLRADDPRRAASMAGAAAKILGRNLVGIEIGNEPTVYYTSRSAIDEYPDKIRRFREQIAVQAPDVAVQGPDVSALRHDFLWRTAAQRLDGQPMFSTFAAHFYGADGCKDANVAPGDVFSPFADERRATALRDITRSAAFSGSSRTVISEANSINCGGRRGISDGIEGGLWALDFALDAATEGVSSVYFHGGLTDCLAYSPICLRDNGSVRAQGVYYALTAINSLGSGMSIKRLSTATADDATTMHAYVMRRDNAMVLALVNTDADTDDKPARVNIGMPSGTFTTTADVQMREPDGGNESGHSYLTASPPGADTMCRDERVVGSRPKAASNYELAPMSALLVYLCKAA